MLERKRRVPARTSGALLALSGFVLLAIGLWEPAFTAAQTVLRTDLPDATPQLPELSVDDAAVAEGDAGERNLVFTLRLTAPSADPVTVDVAAFDSTAQVLGQDFEPLGIPVTFAPGSVAEPVVVRVLGDMEFEADEHLVLRLAQVAGASMADSEAVGTIMNDDLPTLTLDDASIAEGDTGTRTLWFVLHLSSPYAEPVSVDVTTFDSTATAGDQDYSAVSVRFTLAPGAITDSVAVPVNGDTKAESDERFIVRLSNPTGAVVAVHEAVGTISNDDLPALSVVGASVDEGDAGMSVMTFQVRLSPVVDVPVSFKYELLDGTATVAGLDYEQVARDTVFAPGEDLLIIEVPVLGDSLLEGNERFTLSLHEVQGALPAETQAIGTIRNDERATFEKFIPPVPRHASATLTPSWGDHDADGRQDLPLYRNNGGLFEEMPGIRSLLGSGNYHGAAWCDYDRDGDQDLVVMPYDNTSSADNFTHLFENTPNGLVEVAPAVGMDIAGFGETPSWGDFNADGWPDLFLPFYSHVAPYQSFLFLNSGGGQFREFSDSAGVSMRGVPPSLRPEGVGVVDWDGDGSLDIYCASHLFINDGNASFTDIRAQVGLPAVFDEGAQFVDFDDDGDLDLYLRTSQGPTLYRNDGGNFTNATAALGIGYVDWSWGDRWADLDSDGDLDLIYFPPGQVVRLQLNNGDGTFSQDSSFTGVLNGSFLSAFADMDMDGDLDIAIGDWDRQIARNLLERVPNGNSAFLKVRVEDEAGRLTAFGSTVRLRSLDDPAHPIQTRIVDGGSGYLGQDEYTITFGGVGSGRFDLEVSYPSNQGSPRVVGPAQNSLLGGIQPGLQEPQLVVIRPGGQVVMQAVSPATASVPPVTPIGATLSPAAPNPARSMTRLAFQLRADGEISLTIHDIAGRTIRTLAEGNRRAGEQSTVWDLCDDRGRAVPSGLYFVRLEVDRHEHQMQRVVVLH